MTFANLGMRVMVGVRVRVRIRHNYDQPTQLWNGKLKK
jgi:hypothetical protein